MTIETKDTAREAATALTVNALRKIKTALEAVADASEAFNGASLAMDCDDDQNQRRALALLRAVRDDMGAEYPEEIDWMRRNIARAAVLIGYDLMSDADQDGEGGALEWRRDAWTGGPNAGEFIPDQWVAEVDGVGMVAIAGPVKPGAPLYHSVVYHQPTDGQAHGAYSTEYLTLDEAMAWAAFALSPAGHDATHAAYCRVE